MSKRINKKPILVYNSISDQQKTNANSLNVTEWNNIINILKTQANANTKHIETLHRFLIDNYDANTFGDLVLNIDESLVPHLINKLNLVKADILALQSILDSTTQNNLIDLGMFIGGMGLNTNVGLRVNEVADTLVNEHNTDEEAHEDIREDIEDVAEDLQLELSSAVDELNLAISGLESDLLSHKNNTTNAHGINTLIASLNSLSDNLQAHANNTNAHALNLVKADILALESALDGKLANSHNTDEGAHSELFSAIRSRLESIENIIGTIDGEEDANDVIDKLHEIVNLLNGYAEGTTLAELLSQYADVNHDHDEAYVQKEEGKSLFSGSYNDLTNKPNIPSKTSDLENDSGFITVNDIPTVPDVEVYNGAEEAGKYISELNVDVANKHKVNVVKKTLPVVPSKTSQLENDSGFITEEDLPEPTPQTIINLGEFEAPEEGLAECLETGLYYFKASNLGYLIHVYKNNEHIEQWWMRVAGGSNVLIFSRGSHDNGSTWTNYPNFMLHDKAPVSWFTNVSYSMFDLVAYEGKVYFSLTDLNSGNIPSVTLGVHWDEVDYKNVQPDWNQADNTKDDYIKNKPTIPTKVSELENDSEFITEEDLPVPYDDTDLKSRLSAIEEIIESIDGETDADTVINKLHEIVALLNGYAEGTTLANLLSGKSDTNHNHDSVYVKQVEGKTLTDNNLTNTLKSYYDTAYTHSQTDHAPSNAQANIIETVKVNGVALPVSSKAVDITIPETDLSNFYNKSETETLINNAILGLLGGEA